MTTISTIFTTTSTKIPFTNLDRRQMKRFLSQTAWQNVIMTNYGLVFTGHQHKLIVAWWIFVQPNLRFSRRFTRREQISTTRLSQEQLKSSNSTPKKNNKPNETNRPTTKTTTTPYIKGTFEIISHILGPYDFRVSHKPTTTLRHLLTNVKDKEYPRNKWSRYINVTLYRKKYLK